MNERIVAVFGGSAPTEDSAGYQEARRAGRLLAEAGFAVMNGGYMGTMEAVSRGAKEAGGLTLGITSAAFSRRGIQANAWIDREEKAPDLFSRLRRLTQADGFLALKGSVGTLTEVSLTWTLLQIRAISPAPLVLLGTHWRRVLDAFAADSYVRPQDLALIQVANTQEEAVALLKGGIKTT
ncbi:MAG: LOG family protein [Anaerolineae bacterium]|nr:MAG: LOG family protein [Anaerolineae bacterium]